MRKVQNIPWSRNLRQKHNRFSCMPCFLLISDKLGPFCTAGHPETFNTIKYMQTQISHLNSRKKDKCTQFEGKLRSYRRKKIVNSTSYGEERKRI